MLKPYPKPVLITTLSLIGLSLIELSTASWSPAQSIEPNAESGIVSPRNHFVRSPRLEAASVTQSHVFAQGATYYFTLSLPNHHNTPLQQIVIAQQDASTRARAIRFNLEQTEVFIGTPADRGETILLEQVQFAPNHQTLHISLESPLRPGTTVTIALHPQRNPRQDGLYLFGITAVPTGETPRSQFLGFGRLEFYSDETAVSQAN